MACPAGQVYCCIETTKWGCGVPNIIPGGNPKEGQVSIDDTIYGKAGRIFAIFKF